jgi:hypothetical protein
MTDGVCPRCGARDCCAFGSLDARDVVSCRDRELANLHSLHRGVIRKLEKFRDDLDAIAEELS